MESALRTDIRTRRCAAPSQEGTAIGDEGGLLRSLNQLKACASAPDIPYQALIKLLLAESLERRRAA